MKRFYHLLFLLFFIPLIAGAQNDSVIVMMDTVAAPIYDDNGNFDDEEESQDEEKKSEFMSLNFWIKDSFQLRRVDSSVIKAYLADDDFWYANYPFNKPEPEKEKEYRRPLVDHPAFETIMWIVVIAGFITFLFIFLTNNNVRLFRSSTPIRHQETEANFDDIFSVNYQLEIGKAIASGNMNFAVRLLYLRLLSKMAERNIIEYKQDRTNMDYLMQLYKTKYYQDYFRLTRHYEYAWYGQFPVDRGKFELIRSEFENFERNLN
ncbi:DUF4129 domain-containing protein [Terrimonas sp. NA20]|uniref:DUF4129 domain-containing protein n=1 Tax=Terrimonas ginsenosidimutans TaxID=2908004 RepID=A0ABS9KTM6_9BACT|nr:DUF4129 domain-containing protein [Terrimonas ginsenosidimutans]MCG2615691.1 DUF4129 domain-containing protein [Terrimonas ginsenosidimutans]